MERSIAITEKQAGISTQQPKPSPSSKREIVLLLTKFAERRQAQVNGSTLATFAEDLEHFSLTDIEAGLKAISSVRRADGETAFPEIQAIVEAAQKAKRDRRIAAERKRRMADEAAERRRRVEHPEDFIADDEIKDMAARLEGKLGMDAPREIIIAEPASVTCPHCSGVLPLPGNMRMWTADEVQAFADLLKGCEQIAAKNRVVA